MASRPRIFPELKRARILYLLVLPSIVYFGLFAYFPLANGAVISLEKFSFIGKSLFIGFDNYKAVFTTSGFWQAFLNTIILSTGNVLLTAFVPMVLALSLNEMAFQPGKRFLQTILYLPHLFSWVVVGGIWIFILSPNGGIVNGVRALFGAKAISFLVEPTYARSLLIIVNLWKQMGYVCILYLASIAGINPELYEAAMIDGAGGFKRTIYITIPELLTTLQVVLLLNVMGALRIFDQVYVMRNPVIAPKVDVLMYYVYMEGLNKFNVGYASAVSVFIFLITLALTLVVRRVSRYQV